MFSREFYNFLEKYFSRALLGGQVVLIFSTFSIKCFVFISRTSKKSCQQMLQEKFHLGIFKEILQVFPCCIPQYIHRSVPQSIPGGVIAKHVIEQEGTLLYKQIFHTKTKFFYKKQHYKSFNESNICLQILVDK